MTDLGTRPAPGLRHAPASPVRPGRVGRPDPTSRGPRPGPPHLDLVLLGAVLALCGLGALLVWSSTHARLAAAGGNPDAFLVRHLVTVAVGLVAGTIAARVDYRALRSYAPLVYLASCLGLVVVLSPLGSTVNGAHSWIVLGGGFQVQPSEFAKVALVVGIAMVLSERRDRETVPRRGDVLVVLALTAVPVALILLQPDFGTTVVFAAVVLGMLAAAGTRARVLLGLVLAGVVCAVGALQLGALERYQLARLTSFTDPGADPRGIGYTTAQARIAIRSGDVWGAGLFSGPQTQGGLIPEQHTDFVFTVAGEELGLVGAGGLLLLLGLVLWRALRIAGRSTDLFGTLVAVGVVSWFAFQGFINVGMTLGIMPVTGLPLPFVSYGGSAMLANLTAVGLLQNVHTRTAHR